MYAIIRAGGKQAKVHEGDVLDVERIKNTDDVSFTPLLIVGDDGSVISDRSELEKASVKAEILGESAGPKVDIFKYKNKSGYRRRMGHRQKYTKIKVTAINAGTKAKSATKKKAASSKSKKAASAEKSTKAAKAKSESKPKASKPKASKAKAEEE